MYATAKLNEAITQFYVRKPWPHSLLELYVKNENEDLCLRLTEAQLDALKDEIERFQSEQEGGG